MSYRFTTERKDYSDLAAGRVLRGLPGHPALPVRLAEETLLRALNALGQPDTPLVLYDPCCGGAYHLAALGLLHAARFGAILASDIDLDAVALAHRNLDLLHPAGLDQRIQELEQMAAAFGKESHREAVDSARRLRAQLEGALRGREIERACFVADALRGDELRQRIGAACVDLVLTDLPYGRLSQWQSAAGAPDPAWALLETLRAVLTPGGVVAVISDKGQRAAHAEYRRVEQFQVGKRRVAILRRIGDP